MQTAATTQVQSTVPIYVVVIGWVLRLIVAGILVQTLFFKFTGAPESVYIFTKVGAEPWGRIASGIIELIAAAMVEMHLPTVLRSLHQAAGTFVWLSICVFAGLARIASPAAATEKRVLSPATA